MPIPGLPFGQSGPLSSPEMQSGGVTPESNTILASPLADRMGGLAPQNPQLPMLINLTRKGLQAISAFMKDTDPKTAAELETMAAKLLKMSPMASKPVASGMASNLPPVAINPVAPPPVGGMGAFAGPMSGLQ